METFPIESFPKHEEEGRRFPSLSDLTTIRTVGNRKLPTHPSLRPCCNTETELELESESEIPIPIGRNSTLALLELTDRPGLARQFSYPSTRFYSPPRRSGPLFGKPKAPLALRTSPCASSAPALSLGGVIEENVSSPFSNLERAVSHLLDTMHLFSGSEANSVQGPVPAQSQVQVTMPYHSFEYGSTLAHLAAFGILGVLIRYGLTYFFGVVLQVMNDDTALYTELPANAVGSFFMGWVGVVLKKHISEFSEPLAIGLSTGLMGSITTFASWNQKMIALATAGNWVSALVGYLIGMEVAQMSLLVGIETAKLLVWIVQHYWSDSEMDIIITEPMKQTTNSRTPIISLVISVLASGFLWIAAVLLSIIDDDVRNRHILWIACVVAPPGVWVRWYLARFNGKGVISKLKWLPIGTLLANLLAVSLDSGLAVILLVVSSPLITVTIEGLQLGFLGCMSTVSTFVTEVYAMYRGSTRARAFLYILATLLPASILGISLYSVPVWVKGYV